MMSSPRSPNGCDQLNGIVLADTSAITAPIICATIDTEEEFDWNGPFSRRNIETASLTALPSAQKIFERYQIVPTYAVDYPVVTSPVVKDILGPWAAAGTAVIGAHLHPWTTPPFDEVVCPFNSYPCNLDKDLERRKLAVLSEKIKEVFQIMPTIYKAGRYGYDINRKDTLIDLGFTIDASIVPFRSYFGRGGGPNFIKFPDQPFWTSRDCDLLHIPAVHAPIGALRRLARTAIGQTAFGNMAKRLRIPGLLARLHLVELLTLSPEGNTEASLYKLVKILKNDGHKIFTLTFHSTSLALGNTPYTRTTADVSALLDRIDKFLEMFMTEFGGQPKSHPEIAKLLRPVAEP